MNIPLEPDELKKLVELAYLGEWLINAHHEGEFQDELATASLQQVLAAAQLEGIGQDEETDQRYLESDWADQLYERHILDYDDHTFWDELAERLAQRDLAKQRGVSMDEISRDEDIRALRPIEERYRRELERSGVERLELGEDF